MRNSKKIIAFFLAFLMIVSMLPVDSVEAHEKVQETVHQDAVNNSSGENDFPLESPAERESGESSEKEDAQAGASSGDEGVQTGEPGESSEKEDAQAGEPGESSDNDGAQAGKSGESSDNDGAQADESGQSSGKEGTQAEESDEASGDEGAQAGESENVAEESPDGDAADTAEETPDEEDCETISENNPDTDASYTASILAETMAAESDFVIEKKGNEVILKDYTGTATDLIIPDNVTQIADKFLSDNTKITSVTFSSSVKSVGNYAFQGCTSLKDVKLNEGLKTIGERAFRGAGFGTVLDTGAVEYAGLEIPSTVQSIGSGAFSNCKYLKEVTFKDGETTELTMQGGIAFMSFGDCESLETISLPKRLQEIPPYLCSGCQKLKTATIQEGPTVIGNYAFSDCSSLQKIEIPASVETLGDHVLENSASLQEVTLNEGLKAIGERAFRGAGFGTVLDTGAVEYAGLEIPSTVQSIGSGAFSNCKYLKEVTFKDGETTELTMQGGIAFMSFGDCESLETISLPKRLQEIPPYLCSGCQKLKTATIQEGPTAIGNYAFSDCSSLQKIEIPASVETLGDHVFENSASLQEVTLNEGLKTIGERAFRGAGFGTVLDTGVAEHASLEIPSTVQSIGSGAFSSCKYLKEVTFKDGRTVKLTMQGGIAFMPFGDCESLETISLPKRLQEIPPYLCSGCQKLKTATIQEGPTAIGNYAFSDCSSLQKIEIPASVETLGDHVFENSASLREATLNEGLKAIGERAFRGAGFGTVLDTGVAEHASLEIPSTVQSIGSGAFSSCKYLKEVTFKDGRTVKLTMQGGIAFMPFGDCESLETISLPKRLQEIPPYLCYECKALKKIYIPENVTKIGNEVLNASSNVTVYGKSGSYAQIWTATKADKGFTFVDISGVDKTVTSVSLDRNSITLSGKEAVGKTIQLVAAVTPAYAENVEYTFTSDNENVAAVAQDKTAAQAAAVTIKGYGSAKITVTADGKTDECVVTVSKAADGKITSPENNTVFKRGGTAPVVLSAKVEDTESTTKVTFVIKSAKLQKTLEAKDSGKDDIWTAELGANDIDGFGDGKGTIRLLVDEKEMDLIRITFETVGGGGGSGGSGDEEEIPPANIEETEDDGTAEPAPSILEEKKKEGLWIWEEKLNEKVYPYTGEAVMPPVYVYDGETKLREGLDYTVKYSNNVKAADKTKVTPQKAPTVTVTGKGRYTGQKKAYFSIHQADIREASALPYVVKNANRPPVPELWYKGIKLANKRDFTFTYENNKVTITAKEGGNFKGTKTFESTPNDNAAKPISIRKAKIANEEFKKTFIYTGKACTQNCKLTINGTTLEKGRDYTVRYQKNIKAGTASVTYYGRGLYTGKLKKTYRIQAYDISADTDKKIKVEGNECVYAKGGSKLKPIVTFDGERLKEGADYTLSYTNNKQIGTETAVCVITGKGSFKGKFRQKFTVKKQELSKMTFVSSCPLYKEKANNYKVSIKLMDEDGKLLSANKDFDKNCKYEQVKEDKTAEALADKAVVSAGAKIRITIKAAENGPYTGEFTGEYTVLNQSIASAKVTIPPQSYTGAEVRPFEEGAADIKVSIGKTPLTGNDYEIVGYKNNVEKGTATVILRGKGNYGGTKTARFNITAKKWR